MSTKLEAGELTATTIKASSLEGALSYEGVTAQASTMRTLVAPVIPAGQQAYTEAGAYTFIAPHTGTVSVVAIGGGGSGIDGSSSYGGGGGAGLGWKNEIPVTIGTGYDVFVARQTPKGSDAQNSYFINTSTVAGYGGGRGYPSQAATGGPNQGTSTYGKGGGFFGDGGGAGGDSDSSSGSGGGAGGYNGKGGDRSSLPAANSGGAAGGGRYSSTYGWGAGGGTGLNGLGETATGWWHGSTGQNFTTSQGNGGGGAGGSGGTNGMSGENPTNSTGQGGNTGLVGGTCGGGGGGAGDGWPGNGGIGGIGGVRIIWGAGRSYPSNAT